MIKWCCPAFQGNYEAFGGRGFSIVVVIKEPGTFQFKLVSRAIDKVHMHSLTSTLVPVSLLTETGIQFCPWCGCNLSKYYQSYVHELRFENDD